MVRPHYFPANNAMPASAGDGRDLYKPLDGRYKKDGSGSNTHGLAGP